MTDKYCVNCAYFIERGQQCARPTKGDVDLVTGITFKRIPNDASWERAYNFRHGVRVPAIPGTCGPEAAFFVPRETTEPAPD